MRTGALLCLLLAGAAFCAQPEASADASSVDLAARDTTAFHKLVASLGGPASYPETRMSSVFDATRVQNTSVKSLRNVEGFASDPHSYLAKVLPGITFTALCSGPVRGRSLEMCAVTGDGRLYDRDDLNSLLLAEGFSFDSTESQTMAKIAVLFGYFMNLPERVDTSDHSIKLDIPRNPCRLGAQGFPKVEFRSISRQETIIKDAWGPYETKITVVCGINGIPETVAVFFRRLYGARRELDRVGAGPYGLRMRFQPGRVSAPRSTPQGGLSRPDGSGSAQSNVSADTGRKSAAATPITVSSDLTAKDTTAFHRLIASHGGPASYPGTRLSSIFDASGVHAPRIKSLQNLKWYASTHHPFLAAVLPRISFVAVNYGRVFDAGFYLCAITPDGRAYTQWDLNSLLRAEGFTFDSSEIQTIAKIAVLMARFATPPPRSDTALPAPNQSQALPPREDGFTIAGFPPIVKLNDQAFPSVEFRSFTRKVAENPHGARGAFDTRLTMVCSINGVVETTVVDFHGTTDGRNWLDRLYAPRKAVYFHTGRVSAPRTELGASLSTPDRHASTKSAHPDLVALASDEGHAPSRGSAEESEESGTGTPFREASGHLGIFRPPIRDSVAASGLKPQALPRRFDIPAREFYNRAMPESSWCRLDGYGIR